MAAQKPDLPPCPGLTPDELESLLAAGVMRSFQKHTVLVSEGDETDSVFFIFSGRVKIFLDVADGGEVVVNMMGPGEYFGEMALEPGHRSASVMTLEASRIVVIRMTDFRTFLLGHPHFQHELVHKLIQRVRELTYHVRDLALLDVYGRLVRVLQERAREENGRRILPEVMSQQTIANLIGASREMVSRILKDLRTGGYITLEGRRIVILKQPPAAW